MSTVLIESHYFPSIEYFCAVLPFDQIILENDEHYVKQSSRNRCYINTSHGIQMLVVPTTGKHGKVPFRDVRIETGKKWRNNQWRTIASAYAKAPFFEHYADELNTALFHDFAFLHELNRELLSFCLGALRTSKDLSETVAYEKDRHDVSDLRGQINLRQDWSARRFFLPHAYHQVFGNAFVPNLSLLDLIFCEGPNAAGSIKASAKKDLNK